MDQMYRIHVKVDVPDEWRWITSVNDDNMEINESLKEAGMLSGRQCSTVMKLIEEAIDEGYMDFDFDFDTDIRCIEVFNSNWLDELSIL